MTHPIQLFRCEHFLKGLAPLLKGLFAEVQSLKNRSKILN